MGNGRIALVVALFLALSSLANAAFMYGNYEGNEIRFLDVGEQEGYFGTPRVVGDSILFSPQDFAAEAMNGSIDYKNGHMWMTVEAKPSREIDRLEIAEYGDWSLFGNGTANTYVSISGQGILRIEQVERVDLPNPIVVQASMLYKRTTAQLWDDGIFTLPNDGPGSALWVGELKFNLDQILADAGVSGHATRAYFTMDNILFAMTEAGTVAQIEKKAVDGFGVTSFSEPSIPEPGTLSMLVICGCLHLLGKKRLS